MVGQYKLNDRCLIVCAGNGKNDKAIVNDLSTAMVSRLVHIHMKTSFDDWRENVAFKQNYDSRITAFLTAYPNKLMDFEPENEEKEGKPFCCPRSWEFVNRILKVPNFKLDFNTQALLQGTISNDVAIQFTAFCKAADEMETLENIINHPATAKVPSKTDTKWFTIISLLQNFEESYLSSFEQYLTRFNDLSFEVLFYRALLAQTPEIAQNTLNEKVKRMDPVVYIEVTQYPSISENEVEMRYDELEYLAACIEAEAGTQGLMGKRLVCDVILNRVDDDRFPNSITAVIDSPGQFSVVSNGSINTVSITKETFEAIELELEHRTDDEILYFRNGHYGYGTAAYRVNEHYFSK